VAQVEQQLLFKGTPAQFGVAVNSFAERLFRRSGQPQLINIHPDPPLPTANPISAEIYMNWKGPLWVTAQSIPDGRSLLFVSIQDTDWPHFTAYWEMLYKELEQQGWFEAPDSGEPKTRDVQQRILEFLLHWEQTASGLQKNIIVGGVNDKTIAEQLNLDVQIVRDNLDLLQQRGCVLLKVYITGPYRRVANLIALGRTIARDPNYLHQPASTQITNVWTSGGDYASGDIDKRQGAVFVSGDITLDPAPNRQEPVDLEVADVHFELRSEVGTALRIKVKNWSECEQDVSVFVHLPSGETLIPRHGNGWPLGQQTIEAKRTTALAVPLMLHREHPHTAPVITSVEVEDALECKKTASGELIERLNAQIAAQWPYPEADE
jgi:hypothetical protein